MVYWYIMVVPLKFSFWFNFYINSKTSVEFTADKMRNTLTKQEPDDAYKTNLHELPKKKKNVTWTTICLRQIGKPHFANKNILWDISIYHIKYLWQPEIYYPSIFITLGRIVFVYHLNSCVLLIDKQNESCKFSTQ